ncbi:bifunctional 4-hydroxy-2-oxoglutarate aldolase/2-dehydro-3-deoxy-phosphogluconate aldolase [Synechococcus sp. CS-602]|uniref:bifunctional 4-hydroxy-2-oxoglutarate aldolase/2-dehydro-3-deoxy-phosphogluconate aldolase n=1 Tax=Synechococcaceae TaxID=1890426 RepID=UPI0009F84981|nr:MULTISPECIES: bifunctional 4-hydroxy-2-oxoglutarate aldolase/2-dehydro-3-deoxy-phosphogluconate aldolase [Synechococcaceae]MCT0203886.1 bifunctional 4-hydroxy-2-oxoglutarate aldolase/2-dehydro-3-deoxy-phosphogluconate aldolase [Synechococcus sp. CS-602]MCT0246722.1 bifunctional 4-hydroxy-2-oxoglutarate aldolase/2-dehydro-3-deoxy-phosphogluconate aldolase [Synechococcus sp. CS-601]MCT4363506.1 bifunctional 4-hydroxy-2-oxoglutarate aldolase/2-dehydro-3-deoxy-phosphogluconate aldolase [Candidatu
MPSTSEELIGSLHQQPLLLVLRPRAPIDAAPMLERLHALGLQHVEIAWRSSSGWSGQCRELIASFPALWFGAASIGSSEAVLAAKEAGFRYALAPILEPALLRQANALGITLVPGVMTPTEIHQAKALGCRLVKLFPAAALGASYWAGLREPLGGTLPFCIAAGGLLAADVRPWLDAGVDAIALGAGRQGWSEEFCGGLAQVLEDLPRPR